MSPPGPLGPQLLEQLTWHWDNYLRPGLEGITQDEYLWEPTAPMWSIVPRGTHRSQHGLGSGDHVLELDYPEPPQPPPTTIAWRLAHITVGCFAMRNAAHFGEPNVDWFTHDYPGNVETAMADLDHHCSRWVAHLESKTDEELWVPVGDKEPFPDAPLLGLVLHIHRETIHHGAEILLLRDLYRTR